MFLRILNRFIKSNKSFSRFPLNNINGRWLCSATANQSVEISSELKNVEKYLEKLKTEFNELRNGGINTKIKQNRLTGLTKIMNTTETRNTLLDNLEILKMEVENEKDKEMIKLIEEEQKSFERQLENVNIELVRHIYLLDDADNCSTLILEITAGVGGQEAMLFARELFDMYCGYIDYKGWTSDIIQIDSTELGGIRHAESIVSGSDAFGLLKYEAGVHRVQRIPSTEKSGRIHTSTVSVAVIPRPDDIDLQIKEKDLKIETKRASGAGGQHVNTTDSAVRIVHLPTGVAVECQTERSQIKNKQIALKKLEAKLCQQQLESEMAKSSATRKSQIGMSNRNEKIRTYNYNQDRITDHRISVGTLHNLNGFLEGGQSLDELIQKLRRSRRKQEILELVENVQ